MRVEVDASGDRLPKMIRNAEKAKISVMAVVGAKEVESDSLSIRIRTAGKPSEDLGMLPVAEVLDRMQQAIANYDHF